jgi:S1-C subfamily serine protease
VPEATGAGRCCLRGGDSAADPEVTLSIAALTSLLLTVAAATPDSAAVPPPVSAPTPADATVPAPHPAATTSGAAVPAPVPAASPVGTPMQAPFAASAYCTGDYADDLLALSAAARAHDQAQPPYTYCIRATATYECPSYASDGTLRRTRRKVVAHGTGFGYRHQGSDTLVVTNDHVSEWPGVTDAEHPVEDVPAGCKRVASALRIVEDESDSYERDDVTLARVVTDPQLDVSVLRAHAELPVLPWKIGRSAGLRERNVVDIRGFPLGVLRAHNVAKVISTYDHDESGDWNHDDFVIDAPLSPGNSGSPVLAVSCRTGELELVGIYHARYTRASALHVVVGVDQFRDLLTTLKRPARPRNEGAPLDGPARAGVARAAGEAGQIFFPFGSVAASVHARADGGLVFEVKGRDFPVLTHPVLVLEDLPAPDGGFGHPGRVWAGNRQGLREVAATALDADARVLVARTLDALRHGAVAAVAQQEASRSGMSTREGFQEVKRLEGALRRAAAQQDLAAAVLEEADQLCPRFAEAPATLADALAAPATAGVIPVPAAAMPLGAGPASR